MTSVGADFPSMVERLTVLREEARRHGRSGEMIAALCDLAVIDAQEAWKSQDVCAILSAYAQAKRFCELGTRWLRKNVPHG
jgi:hypothetical protein